MSIVLSFVFIGVTILLLFKLFNFISHKTNHLTKKDVLEILENFLNEKGGEWDWDDFVSVPIADKELDKIRDRCAGLPEEFPAIEKGQYCNEEGVKVLYEYVKMLKS